MGIADEIRARRQGVRLSAQRLFTNRNQEKALFERKLVELRELRSREPDWAVDLQSPRRNMLTFYGHGGIGKTRLSRELEQSFEAAKLPKGQKAATARVDFSEPSARDPELFLFALRAGVSSLASAFPAFDTALAVYWARQHPAMSMPEFVRNQSGLGQTADREALARDFRDWAHQLIDDAGLVVGGTSRVLGLTWTKLRNRQAIKRLTKQCPFFEGCMTEDDVDELRLHLPLLLAWDLSQLSPDPNVIVFLDTFERVSDSGIARMGDLEDTIARTAFFLRAALFVVTSRNRLDWSSPQRSPTIEFSGPQDWPGLVDQPDDNGDQHSIGVLSAEDSQDYLAGCLLDHEGRPALTEDLQSGIADLSGGVPLYLDVAVNHYMSLAGSGRPPTIDDFVRGIPELVMRLMEDLDDNESDLLRTASLLGVFDRATLQAGVPQVRASAVENFLARSFVVDRGDQLYSVHELLQTSVRTQDDATSNAWSSDEWRAAEERLVGYWSTQFDDPGSDLWRDRRVQALAFWQLAGLYATTDADAEVLADAVMQVQLRGVWATVEAASSQPGELVNERGKGLLLALAGIMARQVGRLDDADQLLSDALAVPEFGGNMARLTRYYLAETRDIHLGDPTPLFLDLVKADDRIGTEARLAYAHSRTRAGDLAGALAIAQEFPPDIEDPEFRYRLHELLGVIRLFAGQFNESVEHFDVTRQVAESEDSILFMALGRRHLALASCWTEPTAVLNEIDEVERLNRDLNLQPGIGQCLLARAVALTGSAPLGEIDAILTEADATFTNAGYFDDALGAPAIGVFAAAVAGDADLVDERRSSLVARSEGRRPRS